MEKSNVYTCTGDGGQTSLADGTRTSKCCARLESYGEVDELNCHVGLLLALVSNEQIEEMLLEVQRTLFSVGAMLATPPQAAHAVRHAVTSEQVHALEHTIDLLHDGLPPWRGFTLPGGTQAASQAQVCRAVCRRAERRICTLAEMEGGVDSCLLAYVNRLSDMFYVLALRLNYLDGKEEKMWLQR